MTNDLSDYEWERAEALAQKQKQRRIFANHMRHPDPRDPDHIDDNNEDEERRKALHPKLYQMALEVRNDRH